MTLIAVCIAVWLIGSPLLAVAIGRTASLADSHSDELTLHRDFALAR